MQHDMHTFPWANELGFLDASSSVAAWYKLLSTLVQFVSVSLPRKVSTCINGNLEKCTLMSKTDVGFN